MRNLLVLAAGAWALAVPAQERNSTCLWSEGFEAGIPGGWFTNQVERQSASGEGLGEFVPAFTAGTAADANRNGFFPVPDAPVGNRFAMANDDAAPCNCDLSEAMLETPSIDLSGATAIALDLRVHHTQALGGGEAWIDISLNGGEWQALHQLPSGPDWQRLTFSMNELAGSGDARLRFRWSDNNQWASGFAIDDLCLRARLTHDLAVTGVLLGNATQSPFTVGNNPLGYRLLPLEQARAMTVSVDLHNLGTDALDAVTVQVVARQGGVDHGPYSAVIGTIASGARAIAVIPTDWVPDALGTVTYTATADAPTGEDDPSDNEGTATMTMTGAGWDNGYGAMALDHGQVQGAFVVENGFIAANRFEVAGGSTALGVSAVLGTEAEVGSFVRAILMDANFSFVDTSTRHAITPEDIDLAWGGGALYLPFTQATTLSAGDYFVGMQHLSGHGRGAIALSGNCPTGAAALMVGTSFDITWTTATPMVRLHLSDYGVAVPDLSMNRPTGPMVHPQPLAGLGTLAFHVSEPGAYALRIRDTAGRLVQQKSLGGLSAGRHQWPLDAAALPAGAYVLELLGNGQVSVGRLVVGH